MKRIHLIVVIQFIVIVVMYDHQLELMSQIQQSAESVAFATATLETLHESLTDQQDRLARCYEDVSKYRELGFYWKEQNGP